jgi:TonB family protein
VLFVVLAGLIVPVATAQEEKAVPPAAVTPYRVGGAVTRPELISKTTPVYTELARKARVMGVVILEAVIDEAGDVADLRVLKGLPMGLDQAAVEAVKNWKFEPATLEGRPVKVYYSLVVNFQLSGSPFRGAAFNRFLQEHPDFAAALEAERYDEAAKLLSPAAPGADLARIYLLLEQGSLDDAWQAAQGYTAASLSEVLRAVAAFALSDARRTDLDTAARLAAADVGLQAASRTIDADEADETSVDAAEDKISLLRAKAELTSDLDEQQRWRDEAARLDQRVMELRRANAARQAETAAAEDGLLRVGGDVTKPEKISGDPPVSTEVARRARVYGTVILTVVIDEEGNVKDARVLKGLPMGLDQAAMEAVKTWKFKPATLHDKPVEVIYNVSVDFPAPKAEERQE